MRWHEKKVGNDHTGIYTFRNSRAHPFFVPFLRARTVCARLDSASFSTNLAAATLSLPERDAL